MVEKTENMRKHGRVLFPYTSNQTEGITCDTWPLSVAWYKNHQSFDRHPTTKTQMNKNKNGQDNHQTFPDFGQYMVPRAGQILFTLPEHLMILPVFVGGSHC
jgi:hypothetical protein